MPLNSMHNQYIYWIIKLDMVQSNILISIATLVAVYVFLRILVIIVSKRSTLGYNDQRFAACNLAKCVSTDNPNSESYIKPLKYASQMEDAKKKLLDIIKSYGRTKIIKDEGNYIHSEFRSFTWGFIDDVEFYFDDENKEILLRSSSRIGNDDSGENRKRIERIRILFEGKSLKEIISTPISFSLLPKKEVLKVFIGSLFCSTLIVLTYILNLSELDLLNFYILIGFSIFSFAFAFLIPTLKQLKPMRTPTVAWVLILIGYGAIMNFALLIMAGIVQIYVDFAFYNKIEVKQWEEAQKIQN